MVAKKKAAASAESKSRPKNTEDPIVNSVRQCLETLDEKERQAFALALALLGADGSCSGPVPRALDDLAQEYRHKFLDEIKAVAAGYISGNWDTDRDLYKCATNYQFTAVLVAMVDSYR